MSDTPGVLEINKSPYISELSLIPGAGINNNMSSTFGQDVLRVSGYTEKEYEMISVLSKIMGPMEREITEESLDMVQRGLEGRLAKLKQIRSEYAGGWERYLSALKLHQKASQPYLQFLQTMKQYRSHVAACLGENRMAMGKIFKEMQDMETKFEGENTSLLVETWKRPESPLTDDHCDKLIDFVYWPMERGSFFTKETALEGIKKSKRDSYYAPKLPAFSTENANEIRLARWLIGEQFDGDTEIPLQFFLTIGGNAVRGQSNASSSALLILQVSQQIKRYVSVLNTKMTLARSFRLSEADENWNAVADDLSEKFDVISMFAETVGVEFSVEFASFIGNFGVISVKKGIYDSVATIYPSQTIEHWWPLHWLGIKDKEDLVKREAEVREIVAGMPALEIKNRIECILTTNKEKTEQADKFENEWMQVDNWV